MRLPYPWTLAILLFVACTSPEKPTHVGECAEGYTRDALNVCVPEAADTGETDVDTDTDTDSDTDSDTDTDYTGEIGERLVGVIALDLSYATFGYEHFTATGENCIIESEVSEVGSLSDCSGCEFAMIFTIGEMVPLLDAGGCPDGYLEELSGARQAYGHGTATLGETDGVERHQLYMDHHEMWSTVDMGYSTVITDSETGIEVWRFVEELPD